MILWRWVMLHLVKWSDLFCSFVLGGLCFCFWFFLLDCFYDHNHTLSCIFVGDELVEMEVKDRTSALKVVRCTLKRWDQVKIKLIKCKPIAFYESVIHKCFFICAWSCFIFWVEYHFYSSLLDMVVCIILNLRQLDTLIGAQIQLLMQVSNLLITWQELITFRDVDMGYMMGCWSSSRASEWALKVDRVTVI